MADDKKVSKDKTAAESAEEHNEKLVAESASNNEPLKSEEFEPVLTDQQQAMVDLEKAHEEESKKLQESDDPEDMKTKRQQV